MTRRSGPGARPDAQLAEHIGGVGDDVHRLAEVQGKEAQEGPGIHHDGIIGGMHIHGLIDLAGQLLQLIELLKRIDLHRYDHDDYLLTKGCRLAAPSGRRRSSGGSHLGPLPV